MGVWSEFEEKEFEALANASLVMQQVIGKRNIQVFSPGQVLEKTLGFDFATNVGVHTKLHRRLFGATPGAPGITPTQLASLAMPLAPSTRLLNVFLQYKRPEHFRSGHRSRLWPRTEEFLRFTVSENNLVGGGHHFTQVNALDALAKSLSATAIVRYACPTVSTKAALYGLFGAERLLQGTTFVAPSRLVDPTASPPYHRRWTFQATTPGIGRPNPDGDLLAAEDGEQFAERVEYAASQSTRADEYVNGVVQDAVEVRDLRTLVEARKARSGAIDRARADGEDKLIKDDLKRIPTAETPSVSASLEVAETARDLGLQWSILAIG